VVVDLVVPAVAERVSISNEEIQHVGARRVLRGQLCVVGALQGIGIGGSTYKIV
jgi:hypothetical protein